MIIAESGADSRGFMVLWWGYCQRPFQDRSGDSEKRRVLPDALATLRNGFEYSANFPIGV